ncbi:hypothetical protein EJB05_01695, partial [Eragrostis curvula]
MAPRARAALPRSRRPTSPFDFPSHCQPAPHRRRPPFRQERRAQAPAAAAPLSSLPHFSLVPLALSSIAGHRAPRKPSCPAVPAHLRPSSSVEGCTAETSSSSPSPFFIPYGDGRDRRVLLQGPSTAAGTHITSSSNPFPLGELQLYSSLPRPSTISVLLFDVLKTRIHHLLSRDCIFPLPPAAMAVHLELQAGSAAPLGRSGAPESCGPPRGPNELPELNVDGAEGGANPEVVSVEPSTQGKHLCIPSTILDTHDKSNGGEDEYVYGYFYPAEGAGKRGATAIRVPNFGDNFNEEKGNMISKDGGQSRKYSKATIQQMCIYCCIKSHLVEGSGSICINDKLTTALVTYYVIHHEVLILLLDKELLIGLLNGINFFVTAY